MAHDDRKVSHDASTDSAGSSKTNSDPGGGLDKPDKPGLGTSQPPAPPNSPSSELDRQVKTDR